MSNPLGLTCRTCLFWERDEDHSHGTCRAHAPQIARWHDGPWLGRGVWQATAETDWCAEGAVRDEDEL